MKKQTSTIDHTIKNTKEVLDDPKELQKSILFLTEKKVNDKFTDESIDKELLKIELRGGKHLNLTELHEVISKTVREYEVRFYSDYYLQTFRLNGWEIPENGVIKTKPSIVAKWTKEIIYGRFHTEVLPKLEFLNPCVVNGVRRHKHHQFLNDKGLEKLNQYIDEAVDLMKKCSSWYEFRVKMFEGYGVEYQMDLFE